MEAVLCSVLAWFALGVALACPVVLCLRAVKTARFVATAAADIRVS